MSSTGHTESISSPQDPIKFSQRTPSNSDPQLMIHHKIHGLRNKSTVSYSYFNKIKPYGVSHTRRIITPQIYVKKYDMIRHCLAQVLGLTTAQREVVLRLLRIWSYYGKVYPKESQITEDPGCSKATFWRTIRYLEDNNLVAVVNRYVMRPQAQISNMYHLERLVMVIARYLAEHGTQLKDKWLWPFLDIPGVLFWSALTSPELPAARSPG